MILYIYLDASYFSLPKSWSRAEEHYYLRDVSPNLTLESTKPLSKNRKPNGLVFIVCRINKIIMVPAFEAEIKVLFWNEQGVIVIRVTLMELKNV